MESVESYALKILAEAGCDCYTYGEEWASHIMDDLKEAFPNGMKFPYIEVANAILAISRPKPIVRAPWKVMWDNEHACDSYGCDSFEEAKASAMDTLCEWMVQECAGWKSETPTEDEADSFDYMIYNCGVSVAKYNPDTDEYDEVWSPSEEELESIGWKEYGDAAE